MELLSPAGNLSHIKVAIDNKVDAVYGGLKEWNARHKAMNFSIDEYNDVVKKLHDNDIKFYLTLNTLVLDKEIDEIITFLKNPLTVLPDAFIVTDIGLIERLKDEFPQIPLHFSTQFGIHNIDDIRLLEYLGGTRAILARELTKQEIDHLQANTNIELECFVWGSQCLSYSGLCFFGSLMNGGSGNRGKCIITCRDVYTANDKMGHLLYVPDLDCTNMISSLDNIDCIKLEGRRRLASELDEIIKHIKNRDMSSTENGYIYGKTYKENKLFEILNTRIKPVYKAKDLKKISPYDVFMKYIDEGPISLTSYSQDEDVFYVYSEYKNGYSITKKNLSFELKISNNKIAEILYVNYKGEGKTFIDKDNDYINFEIDQFVNDLNHINDAINVYKVKYKRNIENKYLISKDMLDEVLQFISDDCSIKEMDISTNKTFNKLTSIYLETNQFEVINKFTDNKFVKIIYNIASIDNLKKIHKVIDEYDDKIIYKLPLFNFESEDLMPLYTKLVNKEIMFTRLSQIYATKDLSFKKKYTDYTVYIWNKEALHFLDQFNIDEFSVSPELNCAQNVNIFDKRKMQFIIAGKLPLVYTRQCFSHVFGCKKCKLARKNIKEMANVDKQMDFNIICEADHRFMICNKPILNDFSGFDTNQAITYRYVTYGQTIDEIDRSITMLQTKDYFTIMKNSEIWKDSYEGNINESRC